MRQSGASLYNYCRYEWPVICRLGQEGDKTNIKLVLVYLPKGKYCVYPRMVYRLAIVMPSLPHFGWPKITFYRFSRHFRSIRNFIFTKWLPAAILDDRKSLSIWFFAISDQCTTFFFKWPPAAILEVRLTPKTIGFFHYVLSMAMPNMKLIGEFMTPLEMPQAFWAFSYKMAARGHFVFPIDAKNHKVLVIWDLNGYGEYEFDWCICGQVIACTSIGVRWRRRKRRRRNQKHNTPEIFIIINIPNTNINNYLSLTENIITLISLILLTIIVHNSQFIFVMLFVKLLFY